MATVEDQFLCPICLDVFTDPVTIPCGHNFCKNCINEHFNISFQLDCPICNEVFYIRPQLKINTFISEMVAQFRQEVQHQPNSSSSEPQGQCDVCTETKLKALKSCLVCLTSYCETHLEPHLTVSDLKRHQLIDAVENLEDRMCKKHNKPLELYCTTDQTSICTICLDLEHKTHDLVHLEKEQKAQMQKTQSEIQKMIQERRLKIQQIKHSVRLSRKAVDRETAEGVQVFTALMESFQKSLNDVIEEIEERQRRTEKQAEDFIKELEQEISELKKRRIEVEQLLHSEDHLHFLQTFTSVKAAPTMKTWTKVSIRPPSYEGTVVRAVSQLEDKLREYIKKLLQAELRRVQQFALDVTLDPDTAHPKLILSDDGKQVTCGDTWKKLPDNPERFSICCNVLGKQQFFSGRFYFEVQVTGKSEWALGVARQSINRKGYIIGSPQNGYWTIWLRNGTEYKARTDPPVSLSLQSPLQKVGVFVDYEEGLVSFYDVESADLIYSFTGCHFNDKLLPMFSPCFNTEGKNAGPVIITCVRQM